MWYFLIEKDRGDGGGGGHNPVPPFFKSRRNFPNRVVFQDRNYAQFVYSNFPRAVLVACRLSQLIKGCPGVLEKIFKILFKSCPVVYT